MFSDRDLDQTHPQGDPQHMRCRWCGRTRRSVGKGVLACVTCDTAFNWPRLEGTWGET